MEAYGIDYGGMIDTGAGRKRRERKAANAKADGSRRERKAVNAKADGSRRERKAANAKADSSRRERKAANAKADGSRRRKKAGHWELQSILKTSATVIAIMLTAIGVAAGVIALRSVSLQREESTEEPAGQEYHTAAGVPAFIPDLMDDRIRADGNKQKYIAIHFLGVPADGHAIEQSGTGAHFYIYSDGTIYQSASLHKVPWQVGTAGCYTQLHEEANNYNTIGIEMCPLCDGDASDDKDPQWYFTTETQESCVMLVRNLMRELDIPEDHILRHGDIVNKYCPAPYLTNNNYKTSWTWDEFKEHVHDLAEEDVPDFPIER